MSFMPDILSSPRLSAVPVVLMSMILSVPTVNVGGLASVVTLKNNNRISLNIIYVWGIFCRNLFSYML